MCSHVDVRLLPPKYNFGHHQKFGHSGQWKNDKQDGEGLEEWPDGAKYKGQYLAGAKSGIGHFSWEDGATYNGKGGC